MACPLNPSLVIRSNYGDESIGLIQYLFENQEKRSFAMQVFVVYIDTGWSAVTWQERVKKGKIFVERCGFNSIHLSATKTFPELILERKNFPSAKFQWCAGFLKGLPLLDWLDEQDPSGEWIVAIAKRQALYSQTLLEWQECEYHGERKLWYPLLPITTQERDELIQRAGFKVLGHRSLECDPCVNSHREDLKRLHSCDLDKMATMETAIGKKMFPVIKRPHGLRRNFSMGCGDFFGCGL